MAKELLLNVLVNVLGDYIEGITKENLKVGVWSGKIELSHLQLNKSGIEKLKLPLTVQNGYVDSLQVSIPWTSLASQPVRISINGVYLQMGPLDISQLDPKEAHDRNIASARSRLEQAEKSLEFAAQLSENDDPKTISYFQNLATKIIDNLEIRVSNIHVRYEDDSLFPGEIFSWGFSLEQFIVTTTNSNWQEAFVARDDSKRASVHKLITVQNFVLYWNVESTVLPTSSLNEWMRKMESLVWRKGSSPNLQQYVFAPPNALFVKVIHNDYEGAVPKIEASVESIDMRINLDRTQYHQMMRSMDAYGCLGVKQRLLQFRPISSPRSDPMAWWRYALILVTKNERIFSNKGEILRQCLRHRSRYMHLVEKRKLIQESGECEPLKEEEEAELTRIEEVIPLDTLILYRKLAMKTVVVKNKRTKKRLERQAQAAKLASSWFSWGRRPPSEVEEGNESDDVAIEKLQLDLEDAMSQSMLDPSAFTVNFSYVSSTSIRVTADYVPVALMTMACSLRGELRADSLSASLQMTDLTIKDEFTPEPVYPNIVSVLREGPNTDKTDAPPFSLSLEKEGGKMRISMSALPLELCVNKFCIQQLLSVVQVPPHISSVSGLMQLQNYYQSKTSKRIAPDDSSTSAALYAMGAGFLENGESKPQEDVVAEAANSIDVKLDIAAPKIIIPEDSCVDVGCLLLDTGKLSITGSMGAAGMSWSVNIKDVNAGMPRKAQDLYSNHGQELYLIRPFGLSISVQTIDTTVADMTVSMLIAPSISGELDADKLSRLLHIVDVIPGAFSSPAAPVHASSSAVASMLPVGQVTGITDSVIGKSNSEIIPDSREVDPTHCNIDVRVIIPEVSLVLQHGADHRQCNLLRVSNLSTGVVMRPYDMQLVFTLKSLSVEDHLRHDAQRYLVRTPMSSDDDNLVSISLTKINHKKSPLFNDYGTDIVVKFRKLIVNSDARTVLHLRPFYEVLLGRRYTDYPDEFDPTTRGASKDATDISLQSPFAVEEGHSDMMVIATPACVPTGMHITATLDTISLELLRVDVSSDVTVKLLETVVVMDICGLSAEVKMQDALWTECVMQSLTIIDKREISENYHFKTILGPQTMPTPAGDEHQSKDENLLRLVYQNNGQEGSDVVISVGKVSSFLSLDTILDLTTIALTNTMALVELTSPVSIADTSTARNVPQIAQAVETETIVSGSKQQDSDSQPSTAMVVSVDVDSMRVILLEDPTSSASRAISGRCGLVAKYNSVTRGTSVEDTVYVAVTDMEAFVSLEMTKHHPHQIVDPMTLMVNLKRSVEKDVLISMNVSVNLDGIDTRLSLGDMMLVNAILQRRTVVDSAPPPSVELLRENERDGSIESSNNPELTYTSSKPSVSDVETTTTSNPRTHMDHLAAYNLQFYIGAVKAVVINSIHGKHMPLLRLEVDSTTFSADGFIRDMRGSGSTKIRADTFNPVVSEWEPLLETWCPEISLNSDSMAFKLGIECKNTLQLTVTSTTINTLVHTLSSLGSTNQIHERETIPSLTIHNQLGVAIDLRNCNSSETWFHLGPNERADVYLAHRSSGRELSESSGHLTDVVAHLPDRIDMHFCDSLQQERLPLRGLPLSSHVKKRYIIESSSSRDTVTTAVNEPIVEEVYEYQRYSPLAGGWREPFLMGDPSMWSNKEGTRERKRSSVSLPNDSWEWLSDWKVDMNGKIGRDIDADGWDYGLNFTAFSVSDVRRGTMQTMDCARRRRWIRARVPVCKSSDPSIRSLSLFWDVQRLEDGSKQVNVRSCIVIENQMPYDVVASLSSTSWADDVELGVICENSSLAVPLMYSHAQSVKFKCANIPCRWTQSVPCTLQQGDFKSELEIHCVESNEGHHLHMRPVCIQRNKSLCITLHPHIILTNALLCSLRYKFFIGGDHTGKSSNRILAEEGSIEPGSSCKLTSLKVSHTIQGSLQLGDLGWSEISAPLFKKTSTTSRVNVNFLAPDGSVCFVLRYRVNLNMYSPYEIIIFSKEALVDYTGLNICVDSMVDKNNSQRMRRSAGHFLPLLESSSTKEVAAVSTAHLEEFKVRSRRHYAVATAKSGNVVHTDRDFKLLHVPAELCGHTYITTPSDDRDVRLEGGNLIQFSVKEASIIFVLVDRRVVHLPKWLQDLGYIKTSAYVTACGKQDGTFREFHYALYGKVYSPEEIVKLGSNHSPDCRDMYTVLIVPTDQGGRYLDEVCSQPEDNDRKAESCWWRGDCGITMFNSDSSRIVVGINGGAAWASSEIKMKALHNEKGPFEIIDQRRNISYQLAYTIRHLPGLYRRTKILAVMPRYCIVNCVDSLLEIQQRGCKSRQGAVIEPFTTKSWHKQDASFGTDIVFRCGDSRWSLGTIDLNEVGTHTVLLPTASGTELSHLVVNVDIRIACPDDNCAVCIVFWQCHGDGEEAPLSINNSLNLPVWVRQAGVISDSKATCYDMSVPPHSCVPYGWSDSGGSQKVIISVGDPIHENKQVATMALSKAGHCVRLPYKSKQHAASGTVVITMSTHVSGLCVQIADDSTSCSADTDNTVIQNSAANIEGQNLSMSFKFELASIGLSLVADQPRRREVISLYINGASGAYVSNSASNMQSYEVNIVDIQIDNYAETAVYPVLLRRVERKSDTKAADSTSGEIQRVPFFQFACLQETVSNSSRYKYVSFRVIEFALEIDSGTIQLLLSDMGRVKFLSQEELLEQSDPRAWLRHFHDSLLSPARRVHLLDIYGAYMNAKAPKMYFENLVIHPVKAALTFTHTDYPYHEATQHHREISSTVLDVITSMAVVELMEIRLNSFIVTDAVESTASLQSRIVAKAWQDLKGQLAMIAGSLTMLGSPAGLVRNIGGGVQDFFYEPYQGLVQSPQDFVLGIRKGTGSLLAGVVGGALTSTAALVGTASSGIAYLSGDKEFVKERSFKRQQGKAARDRGVMDGIKHGSEEVLSGFASGITGIFTKPVQEAKKEGALGFIKGIGMGVAGVAVKPVLGLTDGLSTIAMGISNEVGDSVAITRVRPSRTFIRSSTDPSVLILTPLNLSAAAAQEYVLAVAKKKKFSDAFLGECVADEGSHIILSENFVYWIRGSAPDCKTPWGEISHCSLQGSRVALHLYKDLARPMLIPCRNAGQAGKLYSEFVACAHLMGNPTAMISLEEVKSQARVETVGAKSKEDRYLFGTANYTVIKFKKMTDHELLKSSKQSLQAICRDLDRDRNDTWRLIDELLWSMVFLWDSNHTGLNAKRCCCALILNESTCAIQIQRSDLRKGHALAVFGSDNFESETKTILPTGCAVVFAYADSPNLYESGNVLLSIDSTAFEVTLATHKNRSMAKNKQGFEVSFIEKSSSEWWSKYVLLVT